MKYKKYFDELQEILEKLENGEVEIDDLAGQIKKAQKLIEQCEKILGDTRKEVEKILLKDDKTKNE